MEVSFSYRIAVATYRALIGNVDKSVRVISIDWSETHYYIRVYMDREPTGEDNEVYSIVTSEIAADFPDMIDFKEELFFSDKPLDMLENLQEIVLLR